MGSARESGRGIAAAPEAGGEVGVLAGFGLALLSLLMYFVLRGVRGIWQYTFGAFFLLLADFKIPLPRLPDIHPFGIVRSWNNAILNALEVAAEGYDGAAGYWFHASARLQGWLADETWKIARDAFHFDHWLVHTWIPTYVHGLTDVLHGVTSTVSKTVTRVEHVTVHVTRIVRVAAHDAAAPAYRVARAATVGAFAPALAIPRLWRGIDDVETDIRKLARRITRTEALFGATALAAAMANVLGIPRANCLRKGPIGRVARTLCGIPTHWLNDLLGLVADFFILENVCTLLPLLESGASVVGTPLIEGLTELGAGLCGGASPPAALRGPMPSIPALIYGASAAAV